MGLHPPPYIDGGGDIGPYTLLTEKKPLAVELKLDVGDKVEALQMFDECSSTRMCIWWMMRNGCRRLY